MAETTGPVPIQRLDYQPPDYLVDAVDLIFDLRDDGATVTSRLAMRRNPDTGGGGAPLVLDGQQLELDSIHLDGEPLADNRYTLAPGSLTVAEVPDTFMLDVVTRIDPHTNTSLEGLFVSGGNFFTQCEAEGFRRITYFPDRPDVMARYTTTIVADAARFPVLLSNGNRIDGGTLDNGRHWAKWEDPFPKPSYLFALVAGALESLDDRFTTASGRVVTLRVFVRPEDLDKCQHAMESLKRSMRWDEEVYGLEYDLDTFMIVAVSDFTMGAMENKGLNIFNTAYVLAKPETATDTDYRLIEGVVAHEYFHNWTGNRVTCRDWFQLSLKEGLTVFRDQQFSADMGGDAVKRIIDVRRLRATQFTEDSGPMAHPVRPESYIEINNFYTATVYQKGAEVVRMIHTLLGPERYRAGIDLYLSRHDGQAVTIEDFVSAMEDAGEIDLGQFRLWYSQAGTPEIAIEDSFNPDDGLYSLTVRQTSPATPGQDRKLPLHIPLALGFLDDDGRPLPVHLEGEDTDPVATPAPAGGIAASGIGDETRVVELKEAQRTFRFAGLSQRPVPSLLRGFSAPVALRGQPRDRLLFLFRHDVDPFARWDAGQQLATQLLLDGIVDEGGAGAIPLDRAFIDAFAATLTDESLDPAFRAEALSIPGEAFLADQLTTVDFEVIHRVRKTALRSIATALHDPLIETYRANGDDGPYRIDPVSVGRRALKSVCLETLAAGEDVEEAVRLADRQFHDAGNMTDMLAALSVLSHLDRPERSAALASFYDRWHDDALVMDKWFGLQARSLLPDTLDRVRALTDHAAFDWTNPNRVRSLIGAFAVGNPVRFHRPDGAGFAFLADGVVRLDRINPQLGARLVMPLGRWRRHPPAVQDKMKDALRKILATPNISPDSYEIASKSLA